MEYRRKIAVGVIGAVLIAAVLGLVASSSFPSGTPATTVTVASTTTSTSFSATTLPGPTSSQTTTFVITSTTSVNCSDACTPTITTNPTTAAGMDFGQIANATMYSPQVQAYVKTAYSYDIAGISPDPDNPNIASVIVNVTGAQTVTGNWTTGYVISYSGIRMLNVTVQFISPSTYELTKVGVTTLAGYNESIEFSEQQQRVIQVALSSTAVRNLMGQSPFYAESVTAFPVTNGTYAGDYFALLYQLNGTRIIGVFVNPSATAVVDAYADSRIATMCWGATASVCFTSPWGATT